jgi:hypothetical protein
MSENIADKLKASLRGEVILPGDAGYDTARKVYNGMINRRPRIIARCADVADVIQAVNFSSDNKMLLAIRGGGHNGPGFGTCDDGLVIDLSRMRGVRVDPVTRTARAEGGCQWGDVDHATHAFGLATSSGIVSTTGVGGLTLGGGHGYLAHKYGLTIDNLLEADMVLADGSFVTVNDKTNKDLFWAIRGGGGNFGIVTSFLYQLHPVSEVYGGPMMWHLEQASELLKWYRKFIAHAPGDVYGWFGFVTVPPAPIFPENLHLKKMCAITWCHTGSGPEAEKDFKDIRAKWPAALDMAGPIRFPVLQSLFDALFPPGLQWYWKGDFFKEISDEAITTHVKYANQLPSMLSTMHLYPINGAVHKVGKKDTAWSNRDVTFSAVYAGIDPDPKNNDRITAWTREYYNAMHKFSAGGAYLNFMMDEGQEGVKATYGENYRRLAEIKKKYDPNNLFHVNQNIKPA